MIFSSIITTIILIVLSPIAQLLVVSEDLTLLEMTVFIMLGFSIVLTSFLAVIVSNYFKIDFEIKARYFCLKIHFKQFLDNIRLKFRGV